MWEGGREQCAEGRMVRKKMSLSSEVSRTFRVSMIRYRSTSMIRALCSNFSNHEIIDQALVRFIDIRYTMNTREANGRRTPK